MKAIKLASIFAVSAVAVAVSTTTFAAEPTFSGRAGLEFQMTGKDYSGTDGTADTNQWNSRGDFEVRVDTGIVYAKMDLTDAVIDEAYVKQGAVSFGDFDGSISDDGFLKATRQIEGEYGDGSKTDLGIRYAVSPNLTVALEMATGQDGVGLAAAYTQDLGMAALTVSAGSYSGETTAKVKDETTNYAVGVSVPAGAGATVILAMAGGDQKSGSTKTKTNSTNIGVSFKASDALELGVQHSMNGEAAAGADDSNTEVSAFYTAGDLKYYAAFLTGDKSKEQTVIGVQASF